MARALYWPRRVSAMVGLCWNCAYYPRVDVEVVRVERSREQDAR